MYFFIYFIFCSCQFHCEPKPAAHLATTFLFKEKQKWTLESGWDKSEYCLQIQESFFKLKI